MACISPDNLCEEIRNCISSTDATPHQSQIQVISPNSSLRPYKMLLIGETGSGKTSFVDLLYNIQGLGGTCDVDQLKCFTNELSENPQFEMMATGTYTTNVYNTVFGDLDLHLIDTPGFGDTRGKEQDKKNVENIVETLNKVEFVNCICLMINGRVARLNQHLKYVLKEISNVMPKEVFGQVIIVFSNTSREDLLNFRPKVLDKFFGGEKVRKNMFYIDNPYCTFEKNKQDLFDKKELIAAGFQAISHTLKDLHAKIKHWRPLHTRYITTLYQTQRNIEKCLLEMLDCYDMKRRLAKYLRQVQESDTKELHLKDFNIVRLVATATTNLLCHTKDCYSNCHVRCCLNYMLDRSIFRDCKSHGGQDHCKECGHHYSNHYHTNAKFEETELFRNDDEFTQKFDAARTFEVKSRLLLEKLEQGMKSSQARMGECSDILLAKIDEITHLYPCDYKAIVSSHLVVIEARLEDSGPDAEGLKNVRDKLKEKLH